MKIPTLADIQRHCARAEAAPTPAQRDVVEQGAARELAIVLDRELGLDRAIALSSPADPGGLHEQLLQLQREKGTR